MLKNTTLKKIALTLVNYIIKPGRSFYTEELQLFGAEKLIEPDSPVHGPCVWACKHEEYPDDIFNLASLWPDIPGRPLPKIMARKIPVISRLPYIQEVIRQQDIPKNADPNTIRRIREKNAAKIANMKSYYARGWHTAMFPEGSTNTDGSVLRIRSGIYNMSHIQTEELEVIPVIPVGLTYDHLTGDKPFWRRRKRVFVAVGDPILYEPSLGLKKDDIKNFTDQVHHAFVSSSVITMPQLASNYITRHSSFTYTEYRKSIRKTIDLLATLDNLILDQGLLDERREQRIGSSFERLIEREYLFGENIVHPNMLLISSDPSSNEKA